MKNQPIKKPQAIAPAEKLSSSNIIIRLGLLNIMLLFLQN